MASKTVNINTNVVNLTEKEFEIWVRTEERGMFITRIVPKCIDTVRASSLEEAQRVARIMGGYAVGKLSDY